ncbi:SLIT and NTRK-like protein 6 [Engraulis encrasicolus]|uniref:SLIT and NTRK-like protein 6 n=1 Tax=Engraulis encrasicolus TaxID=184585 RepID=UPI002FD5B458
MLLCLCCFHYLLLFLPCLCPVVAFLCPTGCCCPQDDTLVLCEFLGLRSLPRSLPLNTSVLSVAHNLICNMDHLLEAFLGLQELSLSHNRLDRFPRGLPASLESLQLQQNLLTYITSRALRQLRSLLHLDLEDNRIRAIQPGAFLAMSRLQVLILKGNRLSSLPLHMPSSLTHLDVSANCILALELPSIVSLVNLEILKINGNCLHSIPENAFDDLPHLYSVELSNNLWVCECDILYLYHWLQNGRQTTATDLICTEPLHLAQKTLLSLSTTVICPGNQVEKVTYEDIIAASHLQRSRSHAKDSMSGAESSGQMAQQAPTKLHPHLLQAKIRSGKTLHPRTNMRYNDRMNVSAPRLYGSPYSLGGLTYQDCLSLDEPERTLSSSSSPPSHETHTSCLGASTRHHQPATTTLSPGVQPASSSSTTTSTPSLSGEVEMLSSPSSARVVFQPMGRDIVAVLSVLCVLVGLLLVAVLLLLKMALLQNQRVHPMQQC